MTSDDESCDLPPVHSKPRLFLCFVVATICLVAFLHFQNKKSASRAAGAATGPSSPRTDGAVQDSLKSKVLGEVRGFTVHLPCNYCDSQSYPVLFMLESPPHTDYAAGMAHSLAHAFGVAPSIIVVEIHQQHRNRDLTPTPGKDNPHDTGGADRFLEFLSKELVPHIRSKYRTRAPLILWGRTLGGLFAFHTLMTKPDLFDAYITASPTLGWNDGLLVHRAEAFFKSHETLERKLYCGVGAGERQEVQDGFDEMTRILGTNAPKGFQFAMRRFEGDSNSSVCIPTTYYGLKFVFDTNAASQSARP